ncbi:MAG: deoxyribonuclease IV [Proteobacteria bacterium]|nr:deoxyribonuclease IV [Pseudomonadota bacterium]
MAHESIAGGVHKAWTRAFDDHCEALQVFVRTSRAWAAPPLTDEIVAKWEESRHAARRKVKAVVAHGSYLVNLGTADEELRKKSMTTMLEELERCERLQIPSLIFHPGSHLGDGEDVGIKRIAERLSQCLEATDGYQVQPTLENTAGQGTNIGYRFDHLRQILDQVSEPERVGVCFDTQHAFASGIDISTESGWEACWQEFDEVVGLDKLTSFHVNDSDKPLGSRVDRHANIGKGLIGTDAFARLMTDPRFADVPGFLETPAERGKKPYSKEIRRMKRLRVKPS